MVFMRFRYWKQMIRRLQENLIEFILNLISYFQGSPLQMAPLQKHNSLSLLSYFYWKDITMFVNACEKHYNGTIIEQRQRYIGDEICWIPNMQDEHYS